MMDEKLHLHNQEPVVTSGQKANSPPEVSWYSPTTFINQKYIDPWSDIIHHDIPAVGA
jgi:hypothetical protein